MNLRRTGGLLILLLWGLSVYAAEPPSEHGQRAIALATQEWKHEETEHFVIHYASDVIGRQVAHEAEFYFRFIAEELGVEVKKEDERYHIFIFESAEGWVAFARGTKLEPWTGAVAIGRELFVPRIPGYRFKGHALGHEIAHLVVNHYLPGSLPLWLSEGYAEEVSLRGYGALMRRRGYRLRSYTLPISQPYPLEELLTVSAYPTARTQVVDFYRQSRQLTAFLYFEGGRERFLKFLRQISEGDSFEIALATVYPREWPSMAALEEAFSAKLIIGPDRPENGD